MQDICGCMYIHIVSNFLYPPRSKSECVTDDQLDKLSGLLNDSCYKSLATYLKIPFNKADNIKKREGSVSDAFIALLHFWKDKTGGLMEKLDYALRKANCGSYVEEYKKE